MKYLFWNTRNNEEINSVLSEIIIENDISFVILAEYAASLDELLERLSLFDVHMEVYPAIGCKRITVLGTNMCVELGPQSERYSIQILNKDQIIGCVHLPSKLHGGTLRRRLVVNSLVEDIRNLEIALKTDKTLIVGDFNENPYEEDFVNPDGLFAVSSYVEAKRRTRILEGKEYQMFYNPMWNLFGDFTEPYGTYFYNGDGECWNIFDQVVISPSLRERFVDRNLKIVTETLSTNLLKFNGRPNTEYSDHLPIIFELEDINEH